MASHATLLNLARALQLIINDFRNFQLPKYWGGGGGGGGGGQSPTLSTPLRSAKDYCFVTCRYLGCLQIQTRLTLIMQVHADVG